MKNFILIALIFTLVGCSNEKIIKFKNPHFIKCDDFEKVGGTNITITVRNENIIIIYEGVTIPGKKLIVAKSCSIW